MSQELQLGGVPIWPPMRITIIDGRVVLTDALAVVLEGEGYVVTKVELGAPLESMTAVLAAGLRSAGRLVFLGDGLGHLGDAAGLVAPLAASGAVVVVLTEGTEDHAWGAAIQQGAKDVLLKSCSLEEVVTTARRVRDGLPLMGPRRCGVLIDAARAERREVCAIRARLDRLTRREMQVLGSLMTGQQVREIARTHVVAEATVRSQVKAILLKMESRSQIAAIGAAYRASWQPPTM